MIKLVAIALATFFSAGIAVDVDAGAPAPEQTTTLPDDATPVPASYNSCVDQCNNELSACEQACTTPMCVFQCEQTAEACINCCAVGH